MYAYNTISLQIVEQHKIHMHCGYEYWFKVMYYYDAMYVYKTFFVHSPKSCCNGTNKIRNMVDALY